MSENWAFKWKLVWLGLVWFFIVWLIKHGQIWGQSGKNWLRYWTTPETNGSVHSNPCILLLSISLSLIASYDHHKLSIGPNISPARIWLVEMFKKVKHLHLQDCTRVRPKHIWYYVELYSTVHSVTAQPNLNLTQLKAGVTFCYSPT